MTVSYNIWSGRVGGELWDKAGCRVRKLTVRGRVVRKPVNVNPGLNVN